MTIEGPPCLRIDRSVNSVGCVDAGSPGCGECLYNVISGQVTKPLSEIREIVDGRQTELAGRLAEIEDKGEYPSATRRLLNFWHVI